MTKERHEENSVFQALLHALARDPIYRVDRVSLPTQWSQVRGLCLGYHRKEKCSCHKLYKWNESYKLPGSELTVNYNGILYMGGRRQHLLCTDCMEDRPGEPYKIVLYKRSHCQYTFSTIPPPLRTARWSVSDAGGTPHSNGTATVIVSFSCNPPLMPFSAATTWMIRFVKHDYKNSNVLSSPYKYK